MKKFLLLLLAGFVSAQIPVGYYNGTENLSGYALKSKIHEIISKKNFNYNYSDLSGFYALTDKDNYYENNGTLLDIYSERPGTVDAYEYNFSQIVGSSTSEGLGFNREHGMPQSTFYGNYPMYSDLHFVIPADARINQLRSNFPYARTTGLETNGTSHDCNSPNNTPCIASNGSKLGKSITPGYVNTVYEPIDEFKGDIARYLLYFVTRYEGSLNSLNFLLSTSPLDGSEEKGYEDWYISMLKEWNTLDPVSQREIDRNNAIYGIEKVRNPFIDHPEWVNLIWSETVDAVAPLAPLNLSSTAIGESFATLTWQATLDTDILGYKVYQNGNFVGQTKGTTFTVDRLTPSTAYQFTVKAFDKGYLTSPDSNLFSVSTSSSDLLAKDLMITKYIEGTTSSTSNIFNNALEITNKTGHEVQLNNYYLSIQFKGANNTYYFSDNFKLEGKILPGESIVVIHPFANFSSYSTTDADFVTAGTPMTFTGTQYIELAYGTKYLKTASTNNYDLTFTTVDAIGFKNTTNSLGNLTLIRNPDVTDPNVNFTLSEWTTYPINYTTGLGIDAVALETSNVNFVKSLQIYPNPITDGIVYASGTNIQKIKNAKVFDFQGRLVVDIKNPFNKGNSLSLLFLPTGNYVLQLDSHVFKCSIR